MPCFHPLPAWRTPQGAISLAKARPDGEYMRLPCGTCLGCRQANAKAWALRCRLELQEHAHAVFTTLTYSDENLPPTLEKRHLQLYFKRLRRATDQSLRFFASGEYGERTVRPHYHAIIFGISDAEHLKLDAAWGLGFTTTAPATPERIAYCAGYTAKKIGFKQRALVEQVDPETGEVYTWQPPFIQMSRRPGIGAAARDRYPNSWRLYAINDGYKMPVPRYFHDAWKKQATAQELEALDYEKYLMTTAANRDTSEASTRNRELLAISKQALSASKRKY